MNVASRPHLRTESRRLRHFPAARRPTESHGREILACMRVPAVKAAREAPPARLAGTRVCMRARFTARTQNLVRSHGGGRPDLPGPVAGPGGCGGGPRTGRPGGGGHFPAATARTMSANPGFRAARRAPGLASESRRRLGDSSRDSWRAGRPTATPTRTRSRNGRDLTRAGPRAGWPPV